VWRKDSVVVAEAEQKRQSPEARMTKTGVNIFEYLDYRKLLKDLYEERKSQNPAFSYRFICMRAGLSSPGFLTKIMQGGVNVSTKTALDLARVLKMNRQETRYFELLVQYCQAKTHEEQRFYFEQLLAARQGRARVLEPAQYELFSRWYYVAIRELLDYYPFTGDYAELAAKLNPPVKPAEARKAIETLESLGLIARGPDGNYVRTDAVVSTGEQWKSIAVRNFQAETADLAKRALQSTDSADRDISTLTLSISGPTLEAMKDRIRQMRRELLEMARADQHADRVCQMNVYLFPLTSTPSKGAQ
jgi:uncharacterized protein (TIGR02147 family)